MGIRRSGIMLHITSLPSPLGIGDLGPEAHSFARLLVKNKQSLWQILPLNPTDPVFRNSPYSSSSAFAGNKLLISPQALLEMGLLSRDDLTHIPDFPEDRVDYLSVAAFKERLFEIVYKRFKAYGFRTAEDGWRYRDFCAQNASWLNDFALFYALKAHYQGRAWNRWPVLIRDRDKDALIDLKRELEEHVEKEKLLQCLFFRQWHSLKAHCHRLGLKIMGDLPFYVNYDSVEVWSHPEIFDLDEDKNPRSVSGVPPDYFSETGQLWGSPTYRWDVLKRDGYSWWMRRLEHHLKLYDLLRIDHFRGLVAYWSVPAGAKIASSGRWVEAPSEDFMISILKRFPCLPIVAEDLGYITPEVREVMGRFGFPGMRVLLFSFGDSMPHSPHAPHNLIENCMVYTGTHDTNTVRGWFEGEASSEDKQRLFSYLGRETTATEVSWELIRLAVMSVADTVIIPMQDLLGLGAEARMNWPGSPRDYYRWRILPQQMIIDRRLGEMTKIYGRD